MVGHSPVSQIVLQIVVRMLIMTSPPAWANSAGMLSTPADFPIFGLSVHAFYGTGDEKIIPTCHSAGNYYISLYRWTHDRVYLSSTTSLRLFQAFLIGYLSHVIHSNRGDKSQRAHLTHQSACWSVRALKYMRLLRFRFMGKVRSLFGCMDRFRILSS